MRRLNFEGELAEVMKTFHEQMNGLAEVEQQRAQLIGEGEAAEGAVTVMVNADGHVIDAKFTEAARRLTLDKLAEAVIAAAKDAVADASEQGEELIAPLRAGREALPKLSDIIPNMPDFQGMTPPAPKVPTDRLGDAVEAGIGEDGAMKFTDVEDNARARRRDDSSEVSDAGW